MGNLTPPWALSSPLILTVIEPPKGIHAGACNVPEQVGWEHPGGLTQLQVL